MTRILATSFRICVLLLFACDTDDAVPVEVIADLDGPNFILVIADDVRFDALGVSHEYLPRRPRFPNVRTPHLDQMAAEGAYFSNAFVTTSLCSPSRASILTGQYMYEHGVDDNHTSFDAPSFASELQSRGYHTGYFGKWHMGDQPGPFPGFDYSFAFRGQGTYVDADFEENGQEVPETGWVDQVGTQALLTHLDTMGDEPFCFVLGYKSCHGPWNAPPQETRDYYQNFVVNTPPNLEMPPPYFTPDLYDESTYNELFLWQDRNYFRSLSGIDLEMGKISEVLEARGLWDNTYLIFMSDNGFYMGEHMLRDKRSAYEESMRIPLLMKGPGISPGTVREELVLNLDIAPTILDLAGAESDLAMSGRSWRPLLMGEGTDWRADFLYEYEMESIGPQTDIVGLRSEDFKLVYYPGTSNWTELYDLTADPYETNNLVGQQEHLPKLTEMVGRLNSFR